MKSQFILIVFITGGFLSCSQSFRQKTTVSTSEKVQIIEKANWLIGDWQHQTGKGTLTEAWHKLDDSTFIGQSYFIAKNDTVSSETIRLEERSCQLSYIPTVQGQNEGHEVHFTLAIAHDSLLIFENMHHDFPQKIAYFRIAGDSLVAEISALVEGKKKSQIFRMGKVKRINKQ
jgi:hypothetical protein